ncbi:MAG: hypothetical protein QOH69_2332 [Actinomycetota bacterium]|jgi:hypothetical protein|nr:hypothetical protein [Actinomycetota bacterium]MDQ1552432.1 hypothetical protein [Actinomycetota bacterium]
MQRSEHGTTRFTIAWLFLAAALCVLLSLWGVQISSAIGPAVEHVATAPVPRAVVAPSIVTDYTSDGTESAETLCGELAPRRATVTVESPSGVILSTLTCPGGTEAPEGCLYSQSTDGLLVVISQKTGSLLTPAQAANCK